MPKFRVTLDKEVISNYTTEIEVEAETEDEAREMALDEAYTIHRMEWSSLWSDEVGYSVSGAEVVSDEE